MNFKNKIILAPLAGVNNIAYRKLCTDFGADIVYSRMIDAKAFIMGNKMMADFHDEKNIIAQFFGNDKDIIVQCAKELEKKVQAFDLNLGCPHSNVVKRKCGSYLMKYPKKIASIIQSLTKNIKLPVTVKIRAGYDRNNINAVKIAKICEDNGAKAVAVHGRARTVHYKQPVNYGIIKKVKKAVNIPVIGNGDIFDGKSAETMYEKTNCDSIMVARSAIGNPEIFNEIKSYLKNKKYTNISKKKIFQKFISYCKKYNIEFTEIKTHAQWLTKGVKNGSHYRAEMNNAKTIDELQRIFKTIPQ
jgi:nifR3 family TIM-barrel protein